MDSSRKYSQPNLIRELAARHKISMPEARAMLGRFRSNLRSELPPELWPRRISSGEVFEDSVLTDFGEGDALPVVYRGELPRRKKLVIEATPTEIAVARFDVRTLRELELFPERIHLMSPTAFEDFVCNRVEKMGFEPVKVLKTNQADGGVDIVAVSKDKALSFGLFAFQAKHHRPDKKTSVGPVRELAALKDRFTSAFLVTNTFFTPDAIWEAFRFANKPFVQLRDFEDLGQWIRGHFAPHTKWDQIPTCIPLSKNVSIERTGSKVTVVQKRNA